MTIMYIAVYTVFMYVTGHYSKYFVLWLLKKNFQVTQQANSHARGGSESSCCYGNRLRRYLNVKKKNSPCSLGNYTPFAPHSYPVTQATVRCNLG